MTPDNIAEAIPHSPPGERLVWVLQRALAIGTGADAAGRAELERQYTPSWLDDVPAAAVLSHLGSILVAAVGVEAEACRRDNEATALLRTSDGGVMRLRCVVEDQPPHRIIFQLLSPALDPSAYVDRVVERNGQTVHARDFGGDGPVMLLWHGAGCDATVWEAMAPHLKSFRVIAQDLPAHGASPLTRISVSDAIADAQALLDGLGLDNPILVGHSMGGWAALQFAATTSTRALVCLDGPTALEFTEMGLQPGHAAYLPDPPDVRTALAAVKCPAMIVLCCGSSPSEEEWMIPFRTPLSDHLLAQQQPATRVVWRPADHMLVLSQPTETAALITTFALDEAHRT